jgi:hypothetical protein
VIAKIEVDLSSKSDCVIRKTLTTTNTRRIPVEKITIGFQVFTILINKRKYSYYYSNNSHKSSYPTNNISKLFVPNDMNCFYHNELINLYVYLKVYVKIARKPLTLVRE